MGTDVIFLIDKLKEDCSGGIRTHVHPSFRVRSEKYQKAAYKRNYYTFYSYPQSRPDTLIQTQPNRILFINLPIKIRLKIASSQYHPTRRAYHVFQEVL